jgi:hypothetical protein
VKDFAMFAALQFIHYLNLTINFRAIAHEQYVAACLSDGFACVLSYTIVKRISGDKSRLGVIGMTVGGMGAAVLGIWLTREWA